MAETAVEGRDLDPFGISQEKPVVAVGDVPPGTKLHDAQAIQGRFTGSDALAQQLHAVAGKEPVEPARQLLGKGSGIGPKLLQRDPLAPFRHGAGVDKAHLRVRYESGRLPDMRLHIFRLGQTLAQIAHIRAVAIQVSQFRIKVFQLHAFRILSAMASLTSMACPCR